MASSHGPRPLWKEEGFRRLRAVYPPLPVEMKMSVLLGRGCMRPIETSSHADACFIGVLHPGFTDPLLDFVEDSGHLLGAFGGLVDDRSRAYGHTEATAQYVADAAVAHGSVGVQNPHQCGERMPILYVGGHVLGE